MSFSVLGPQVLQPGESIVVDPSCVLGWEESVTFDLKYVPHTHTRAARKGDRHTKEHTHHIHTTYTHERIKHKR